MATAAQDPTSRSTRAGATRWHFKWIERFKDSKLVFDQKIGNPDCPIYRRSIIALGGFSLRLHRWYANQQELDVHNHPWWFITLVIQGQYTDVAQDGTEDHLRVGSIRFRPSSHRHCVRVGPHGATTILITGRLLADWGFFRDGKFWDYELYRATFTPAPCADHEVTT